MKILKTLTILLTLTFSFSPISLTQANSPTTPEEGTPNAVQSGIQGAAQSAQGLADEQCKNLKIDTVLRKNCEAVAQLDESICEQIKNTKEYENLKNNNNKTESQKKIFESYEKQILTCKQIIGEKKISNTIETNNKNKLITNFQNRNCFSQDDLNGAFCKYSPNQDPSLDLLNKIINNNFVYQLIDPISNENLIIQERVCTFDFKRDGNGLFEILKSDNTDTSNIGFITENKCYTTYVLSCQPNLIINRNINFLTTTELPISRECKTFQVIYGSSGTDFIKGFVSIIYRLAVSIVGVISVLVMVINGIRISTAGDDSAVISDAKERITQSIFGLALLFFAWIILRSVNPNFFTTDNLIITDPTPTQTEQAQPQPTPSNTN